MSWGLPGLCGLLATGRWVVVVRGISNRSQRFGVLVWLFVCSHLGSGFVCGCVGLVVLIHIQGSVSRWLLWFHRSGRVWGLSFILFRFFFDVPNVVVVVVSVPVE